MGSPPSQGQWPIVRDRGPRQASEHVVTSGARKSCKEGSTVQFWKRVVEKGKLLY